MSRPSNPKKKNGARFDPIVFFSTVDKGRAIHKNRTKDVIFAQGDAADAVFYIKKGKFKVTVVSSQGKEAVVAILGVNEFVGEGCLIGQPTRADVTLGETYPRPIVDHALARKAALAGYQTVLSARS